jgi:hypothetical protein
MAIVRRFRKPGMPSGRLRQLSFMLPPTRDKPVEANPAAAFQKGA